MIPHTKFEAAYDFTRELLASEVKQDIVRVVLFGSVARGEAREESDIDLLVIASGDLERVRDICADASLHTWVKWHQGVEPLVYCIDNLRFCHSSFLEQVIKKGQEVFSMAEEERLKKEARDYLYLAEQYLESAKRNLLAGDPRVAIDTAYNCSELCIKALILLKAVEIPGSHGGVVNRFGELYVLSGDLPKECGRKLNRHLELRNRSRYDPHAEITTEGAKEVISLSEDMIRYLASRIT